MSSAQTNTPSLHTQHWKIENPKAAVVLVHGIGEHIGRYEHVAARLNTAGYAVAGQDHRGHGKSPGEPRAFIRDVDVYVDDLKRLWDQVQGLYPHKPLFMLGHSLGGQIAVRFTLRYQDQMQGLVTSGAGLAAGTSISPVVVKVATWLGKIVPKLPLQAFDANLVSHDPVIVEAYQTDPLVYQGKILAGMGTAMAAGADDALARAHTIRLPSLILHGEADQIVNPSASQMLYEKISSKDKTLKTYPGLYHEIFNEIEKETVLQDVVRWLDAHLPS